MPFTLLVRIEDVSINNEYKNDFKPYSYLKSFFSAFYVSSDDTEFEFIENKIMGFHMTWRQFESR